MFLFVFMHIVLARIHPLLLYIREEEEHHDVTSHFLDMFASVKVFVQVSIHDVRADEGARQSVGVGGGPGPHFDVAEHSSGHRW